ncbi:hypothetical protein EMCRGX_G003843 [Ephydatia muelleri]
MSASRPRQSVGSRSPAEARRSAGNAEASQQSQPTSSSQQHDGESSQVSRGRAEQAFGQMGPDLQKRKVSEMVRYLMMSSINSIPVRKKELVDKVLGAEHSRTFPVILEKANHQLAEVFGMKVEEVLSGKTVCYILVNCLPVEKVDATVVWSDVEKSNMGLLFVLLSILLLKAEPVTEDQLWNMLEKMDIRQESRHPTFGDVKTLINGYVDKMYLKRERQAVGETAKIIYQWGPRARCEVDRKAMLTMVAELHESDPGLWERQYQKALEH